MQHSAWTKKTSTASRRMCKTETNGGRTKTESHLEDEIKQKNVLWLITHDMDDLWVMGYDTQNMVKMISKQIGNIWVPTCKETEEWSNRPLSGHSGRVQPADFLEGISHFQPFYQLIISCFSLFRVILDEELTRRWTISHRDYTEDIRTRGIR